MDGSTAPRRGCSCLRAFTLIELLTVVAIIAILAGLLLTGVTVVRNRAKLADARQLTREVVVAMEAYRAEDRLRRYPAEVGCDFCLGAAGATAHAADPDAAVLRSGIAAGTTPHALEALLDRHLLTLRAGALRDGVLVDPWGEPLRYLLSRPAAAGGATDPANAVALDWNWDPSRDRVRAWDDRRNRPGDFPYVWSFGPRGPSAPIPEWCYATP